jgi:hypothetical protein
MPLTILGSMVQLNPLEAERAILEALEDNNGNVSQAAIQLNVPLRSLRRYLVVLKLQHCVTAIKATRPLALLRKEIRRVAPGGSVRVNIYPEDSSRVFITYGRYSWLGDPIVAISHLRHLNNGVKGMQVMKALDYHGYSWKE